MNCSLTQSQPVLTLRCSVQVDTCQIKLMDMWWPQRRQYMCAQKRPTTNMVRVTLSVTLATHYKHGRGRVIDGGDFRVKPLRCIHNGPYITMGQTPQNESGTVKEDLKRIKIRQKSMQLLKSNLPEIFAGYASGFKAWTNSSGLCIWYAFDLFNLPVDALLLLPWGTFHLVTDTPLNQRQC